MANILGSWRQIQLGYQTPTMIVVASTRTSTSTVADCFVLACRIAADAAAAHPGRPHESCRAPDRRRTGGGAHAEQEASGEEESQTVDVRRPPLFLSMATIPTNNVANKKFTMSEMHKHASRDAARIVVHGGVYDCTEYLTDHPSGADNNLIINVGTACTRRSSTPSTPTRPRRSSTPTASVSSSSPPAPAIARTYQSRKQPPAPVALSKLRKKVRCRLIGPNVLSCDACLLCFVMPSPDQALALPTGKHLFVCTNIISMGRSACGPRRRQARRMRPDTSTSS
ncbi:unnamed protein product [Urochloa humidicola]